MTAQPTPDHPSEYQPLRPLAPADPVPEPEPEPSRRSWRDRVPSWWLRAVAGALAIALLGTAFFAYRLSDDLSTARATIATQRDQLATTKTQLDAATARGDQLTAQVGALQSQLQQQRDCVSALQAESVNANDIENAQIDLYNLSTEGSAFDKAQRARDAALLAAAQDYYNAYDAAWNGGYATANTWVDRANAQMKVADNNLTTMNTEIDKMNTLNHQIEGMLATAGSGLGVCASGGTSSS